MMKSMCPEECVSIAELHHHHAEIVAVKHLLESLGIGDTLTLAALHEVGGVTFATLGLAVVAQVDDLHAFYVEAETLGALLDHLLVAEKHRYHQALLAGDDGSLEHLVGIGFGEYHTFWLRLGLLKDSAQELVVIAHH